MNPSIFYIALVWLLSVALSFSWNYINARHERERIALETSRAFFKQLVITREWNADHGGVYVPVTDETQPNPYLEDPLRDIAVGGSLALTKVNPSFMTRQLSEIAERYDGVKFHITSLKPLRPENRPDEWERKSLQSFEQGVKEAGEFIGHGSTTSFLYMAPLITHQSCLTCHAKQGYREGDIRGGIRIALPAVPQLQLAPLLLGHIGIGSTGLLIILLLGRKLEKAHTDLRRQAVMDALTGIPNRRYFTERVVQEFKRCRRENLPLSIIMCDIDYFKRYNDGYGHKSGDECLMQVAKAIQNTVRRPGDFCARYGGEEFIIVLPNTPKAGAMRIAETVRVNVESLHIPHQFSPAHRFVTLSLGLETAYSNNISYEEAIKQADAALYRAKEQGRNRVEVCEN